MSLSVFFATALVFGMRHALDPDHVVAVSTLVAEERRIRPVASLGFVWGLGHMLPILLLGLPVLLLELQLPAAMEHVVDLGVGLLLIVLGIRTIYRLRQESVHFHVHDHGGGQHAHFHTHRHSAAHGHAHGRRSEHGRRRLLTFGTGMMHGLAGSGAVSVMAITAAPSLAGGVGYLIAFGIGTCLGMLAMTLCVAAPALTTLGRFSSLHHGIRLVAGAASIVVGALMWFEIVPNLLA